MHLSRSFSSLRIGEKDNFAFDFTYDIGDSVIESGNWMCVLAPYQSANDPNPQSHVISFSVQTVIAVRVPPSGKINERAGNYVVAFIDSTTMVPATYIMEGTAFLNDGRVLILSANVVATNSA